MPENLTQKLIRTHLVSGEMKAGAEIGLRIDQTLTQDATGTMVYLEFEALGMPRVRTKCSVSYVDHNILQTGFENADDHRFLQSAAARYGLYFSRPGNGICHQVHLERFAVPGQTLVGSDSHTPTAGGLGMLAIGAGGLDVAVAMAGEPFYLPMPKVTLVRLVGKLGPWVTAKDVILELLRRLTVHGGVGKVMEYGGPGVATLTVPQRATIPNLGAARGATTSIFPSDEMTRQYLRAQGREAEWQPLAADADASYDEMIEIDLGALEPMVAQPSSPDNGVPVAAVAGTPLGQICIGSCSNSSYEDLMAVAAILRGRTIHPGVSLTISPGTKQVYTMIARNGALADLIAAGARILESACGPCIGMGQSPATGVASLRSFNRNFPGRSGTRGDRVYLASPEVCAASALTGQITDPRTLGAMPLVQWPEAMDVNDNMIIAPQPAMQTAPELVRGPNIQPLPTRGPLSATLRGELLLKVGDNITTDHIMPAGAQLLPLRSNIPACAEHVFEAVDATFVARAKAAGGGFIVGGINYGQGSSREHAALTLMHLGVQPLIPKSIAPIHHANLVNIRILPHTYVNAADYDESSVGDVWEIENVLAAIEAGETFTVKNLTRGTTFAVRSRLSGRQIEMLRAGGLLNYVKMKRAKETA